MKRAHFYSDATRELYVELPSEAKRPREDVVGKLLKSLWNARRTSELGVADSESDDCLRFQTRQEQSPYLFPRRS